MVPFTGPPLLLEIRETIQITFPDSLVCKLGTGGYLTDSLYAFVYL